MTLPSFFIFFSLFDEPKVGLVILVNLIFWHEIRFMFLAVHLSSRSRQGRPRLEGRYAYLNPTIMKKEGKVIPYYSFNSVHFVTQFLSFFFFTRQLDWKYSVGLTRHSYFISNSTIYHNIS